METFKDVQSIHAEMLKQFKQQKTTSKTIRDGIVCGSDLQIVKFQ